MKAAIEKLLYVLPLIFGIGFFAPLSAEIFQATGLSPFGLPPLAAGLILGTAWGAWATWRRNWLWV
jgi:hypothetical protein